MGGPRFGITTIFLRAVGQEENFQVLLTMMIRRCMYIYKLD